MCLGSDFGLLNIRTTDLQVAHYSTGNYKIIPYVSTIQITTVNSSCVPPEGSLIFGAFLNLMYLHFFN